MKEKMFEQAEICANSVAQGALSYLFFFKPYQHEIYNIVPGGVLYPCKLIEPVGMR